LITGVGGKRRRVTRISVSDPQQILCSSSGMGDLIGGSSIASPTLGAPGRMISYALNFYPEAAGRKCLRLFQLGGGSKSRRPSIDPAVANSDEALRSRRILYLET
jgi:hypothetical protein